MQQRRKSSKESNKQDEGVKKKTGEREQQQLGFNKSMQSSLCKKERKKEGDLTKIKRNHGSIVIDHITLSVLLNCVLVK